MSYLVTWLNQGVVEAYLLTSPLTAFSFAVVISAYMFCYADIAETAARDLSAECDASAEYPACTRQSILSQSSFTLVLEAILLVLLGLIN